MFCDAGKNKELDEDEGWRNKKKLKDYGIKYSVTHLASNADVSYKCGAHQLETIEEVEGPGSVAQSCDNHTLIIEAALS